MATQTAIVDDQDPLIKYSGTWTRGGASQEFDSTTMSSTTAGSTASFTFVGTSITVYGTVAAKNLKPQATWSFVVDGSITGTYTPPNNMTSDIHHEALWTSPAGSITNGTHELVITQSAAASDDVLFLDYILYTTTSLDVGAYFIDDRDPQIKYTPAWRQFGSDPDFQHTSQATTNVGDSLSLTFEGAWNDIFVPVVIPNVVKGSSIRFFGGFTSATEQASIAVDGGPATIWIPPSTATQTNNLIYSSGNLTPGNHTIVVTAMNDQAVWADYFLVTPNPPGTVISGSSSSSGSPSGSSTPSPSNTPQPSHKSTPVGAIVGPIVGVLALVALVAAIFLCRRRRRQQDESVEPPMSNGIAPGPSFSGYAASGAAGEPGTSSAVANSGHSDPDSPFATSSNPHLASTSYPVASLSDTLPNSVSAPQSTTSGESVNANVISNPNLPPTTVQSGMIPSNKLLREAERARQWHVSSPSSSSATSSRPGGGQEMPPHYSE
ncbi:hypothetical protein MVEN_00327200 [Mycena venus]|uniref:Uncharacterized protein n=1 Tax=Mycena venus TaxID=2733690 RepID=A0A8H6YTH2_9AGAR|nr:hypothetical protein MVEN_00327200 [Mycena venus]